MSEATLKANVPEILTTTPSPPLVAPVMRHLKTDSIIGRLHSDTDIPQIRPFTGQLHRSATEDTENTAEEDDSNDLLQLFNNKLSDGYRNIKLSIPQEKKLLIKQYYQKRVSFDTIDILYDDDINDLWDDTFGWELYDSIAGNMKAKDSRGRNRAVSPRRSPAGSPGELSPLRGYSYSNSLKTKGLDLSNYDLSPLDIDINRLDASRLDESIFALLSAASNVIYPTRPIITHRGCTYSKLHKDYENLYLNKLNNKEHGFLKPVLALRTILVYISGRKHTWVALDWILRNFIEHGDTVIVVSAVNSPDLLNPKRRNSYYSPHSFAPPKSALGRFKMRNKPEYINFIARNVMSYIMEVINPNVIAKITVEIAVGKTKDVLKEMYKLYEPNLVSTGTKPNSKIGAPLRSWLSSKLTDRLVKNFPLPVIVVPAVNMCKFEYDIQDQINQFHAKTSTSNMEFTSSESSQSTSQSGGANSMNLSNHSTDSNSEFHPSTSDEGYASSISSESSVSSEGSYSSYQEISNLYYNYKNELSAGLQKLKKQPIDEMYFANQLRLVSEKSATLCEDIRGVDPDFRGNGSKLARAITGSNSFGVVPYKTKSLLDPVVKTHSMSYSELKKNLQKRSSESKPTSPLSIQETPAIIVGDHDEESPDSTIVPKKSALTFVNLQPPNLKKIGNKLLQKSLSHDINDSSNRPKLEPLKSHPDLKTLANGSNELLPDGKRKKSKKKFWKFF